MQFGIATTHSIHLRTYAQANNQSDTSFQFWTNTSRPHGVGGRKSDRPNSSLLLFIMRWSMQRAHKHTLTYEGSQSNATHDRPGDIARLLRVRHLYCFVAHSVHWSNIKALCVSFSRLCVVNMHMHTFTAFGVWCVRWAHFHKLINSTYISRQMCRWHARTQNLQAQCSGLRTEFCYVRWFSTDPGRKPYNKMLIAHSSLVFSMFISWVDCLKPN